MPMYVVPNQGHEVNSQEGEKTTASGKGNSVSGKKKGPAVQTGLPAPGAPDLNELDPNTPDPNNQNEPDPNAPPVIPGASDEDF